jgi:hypothetical protein
MDQVSREAGARSEAWLEQVRPIPDDKTAANGRPSQTPQLGAIQAAEEPRRDLEIVYVEGSLEQITELVSDLDASKTEFRSLAVDRTPVKKLQMLRKPDNAATPTDAMGDVHARGEAVPESKPMGLAIDDRVPREEKNGPSIAKSEAGKELHGLREGQAEAKDAASQPGNKAQSADKSAPADSNAPAMPSAPETPPAFSALRTTVRAPGAAPPTAAQAAPDSAKSPAGRENRDGDKLMSEERSLELGMNPSRPKQADRGKGEEGEPFGYAFWLYPLPTEAKQELKKEQLDRFKFQKQQVEDASPASTALGSVAAAKSPPPTPSAPPSASAAAPTARPVLAEPTQPSPIQSAPTNKATTRPEDPSAPKSAKAPAAEGRAGGRPEADKPAVEKPPETGGVNAKLRDESKDFQAPPAAMPPSPPTPQDFERSFNRKAPRAGAQVVAKDDAKAGGAAAPSPRIQAILIFRIDPPPTSAAPPPAAGPASDVKAKQ